MHTPVQQIIRSFAFLCVAACTARTGGDVQQQQTIADAQVCSGHPRGAYAIVTSAGPGIVDANGTQWFLTADAKISVNGVVDPVTQRVTQLALVGGVLWQENADNAWYSKTSPTDNWTPESGTSTSPLSQSVTALVVTAAGAIVDASGAQWTLTPSRQIAVNGTVDPITKQVSELTYIDGVIWQESANNLWWSKTSPSDSWAPVDGTPTSPLSSESPDKTVITTAGPMITDACGNTWAITTDAKIAVNGVVDPITQRVIELAYVGGVVWQENADDLWYSKSSPSDNWTPEDGTSTSPLTGTNGGGGGGGTNESPSGTVITTVGPTITDANNATWTLTSGGQIAVNGTVDPITANVIVLAYINHVVWQENASNEWYSWTGSSWADQGTTAPAGIGGDPCVGVTCSGHGGCWSGSGTAACNCDSGYHASGTNCISDNGSGGFSVSGGKIIGPNGQPFVGYGFNILDDTFSTASINDIQTLFPKVNLIRLAIGGDDGGLYSAQPLATIESWVNGVTAQGIVVMVESHYTGQPSASDINLNDEYNYYHQLASDLKDNSYVWFMSGNELNEPGVSAEHQNVYNAIRDAGNNTIIVFTVPGGNPVTPDDAGTYRAMTNIAWDQHWYNWMSSGDTNQSNVDNDLANVVGSLQAFTTSADGIIPVITGETGFIDYAGGCGGAGSLGDSFNCGTGQIILSSFHAASIGVTSGTTVWLWHFTCCHEQTDLVDYSTGTSLYNPYGQWVQSYIDQYSSGPL